MANKIVELEQQRDDDLEQLETRMRLSMADSTKENERMRYQLTTVVPQVTRLKEDCR